MIAGEMDCLHSTHFKLLGTNSFYLFKHSDMKSYLKYRGEKRKTLKLPEYNKAKTNSFNQIAHFVC